MKKLALTLVLAGTVAQAAGVAKESKVSDWQSVGSSDTSELKLDKASIKERNKDIREAWSMWNFKEARMNNGDATFPTFKSYQDFTLYNCKTKTLRLAREILFVETDGGGAKKDNSDALKNSPYTKPAEGSVAEVMMNFVCASELNAK